MRDDVAALVARLVGDDADLSLSVPDHPDGRLDAVALLDEQLSAAGPHAESLLDAAVRAVRPGGTVAVTLRNALTSGPDEAHRTWRPEEVRHLMGGRGIAVTGLWGVGARARLAGWPESAIDVEGDRTPSLVGAADVLLAVGRTPRSARDRSDVYMATLPTKTVAAATLTRRDDGMMLVVRDVYKGHWTIPGGVVDADEDPRAGAERETYEESGIHVSVGDLGGVFHGRRPDRLILVFHARPRDEDARAGGVEPRPLHPHEVDDATWVPVAQALRRVADHTAAQIRRSIDTPGQVWSDRSA